jgi:hypothetical protein
MEIEMERIKLIQKNIQKCYIVNKIFTSQHALTPIPDPPSV